MECESLEYQNNKKENHIFTSKEIKEKGYEYSTEPEAPIKCKGCGKELYQRGIVLPVADRVMTWLGHERCTCQRAVAYWTKYDARQEEIKQQEKREEENRQKREKIERLLGESRIKKRFLSRTLDNFKVDNENKEAFTSTKLYIENFEKFKEAGEGLYYSGGFGTGKTHLAISIAQEIIKKGNPVICMTAIDLLAEIRRTYDKDRNVSEYQILQAYKETDLLIIDDLGKENCSEWAATMLYDIINDRYEQCLPTVITTNYNDEDLINRLARKSNYETAGAIVSRLHEVTMGITVNGKDRRRTGI